jgi:hypothetical protein
LAVGRVHAIRRSPGRASLHDHRKLAKTDHLRRPRLPKAVTHERCSTDGSTSSTATSRSARREVLRLLFDNWAPTEYRAAMPGLPNEIEELLRAALVADLTVLEEGGRPTTHPLIPLFDGERILMTSSILFSKKLECIRRNPKVALSISDPSAVPNGTFHRATIQGDARVDDTDIHHGWERVLPLWRAKEPSIERLFAQRFALPLFWERAVIEIEPRRAFFWRDGRTDRAPEVVEVAR